MEFINLKNLCNISKIFKNFKICCQSCTFNYKLISFELFFFWSKFPSKLAARIRKAFWNGVINNRFWIMHLTNWVSFFFLVFAVLLFYSYPIIPFSYSSSSSKNMAQETPNSIYDFTVKVFFNLSSSFLSGFFFISILCGLLRKLDDTLSEKRWNGKKKIEGKKNLCLILGFVTLLRV